MGIAAAAHLIQLGITPLILEQGSSVATAMLEWGHVQVFTPWKYIVDRAVASLLSEQGWSHPDPEALPSAKEIVDDYLYPASQLPQIKNNIIYDATVIGVSKRGLSKSSSKDRETTPFTIHYVDSLFYHRAFEGSILF